MTLPDVYGQGAIFAFSGLDGSTYFDNDFTATLTGDNVGLLFHLKVRRTLILEFNEIVTEIIWNAVLSDFLDFHIKHKSNDTEERISIIFKDAKTVIGETSKNALPKVIAYRGAVSSVKENSIVHSSLNEHTALYMINIGDRIRFAFAFDENSPDMAVNRAKEGVSVDISLLFKEKKKFYSSLPDYPGINKVLEKTYYKAFSVLKSTVMSPEGMIKKRWVTPDRVPHRKMWLWDSVFQAVGISCFDNSLAVEIIESVLGVQTEDGFIPHMASPHVISSITQPPVLAWGLWKIYEKTKDKSIIEDNYDRLVAYILRNMRECDENGNNLYEWFIEGDENCRSGESGQDNSPRFDDAEVMDAVDFSSFMANEMHILSQMAKELGKDPTVWEKNFFKVKDSVNRYLWDENRGFYFDRNHEGTFSKVMTVSAFTTFFAGIADKDKARKLVCMLTDLEEFASPVPVPSVALSEAAFSTDMWRGPMWVYFNYMIIEGLEKYGYDDLALNIARKTLMTVSKWYIRTGCLFEYYDSKGDSSPEYLDRKGRCTPPYDIGRKCFPVRDYGWTAALFIDMALKYGSKL